MTDEVKSMDANEASNLLYETQEKLDALSADLMGKMSKGTDVISDTMLSTGGEAGFFITGLTVFILACFVGYYVVWKVTPALHSPLMSVTNAISSVVIVGAILAATPEEFGIASVFGFIGIILASINIFGGFVITQRMLSMFKKKGE